MKIVFPICCLFIVSDLSARSKRIDTLIDPHTHVYGHPWGTPKQLFIRLVGEPVAQVKFDEESSALLYGRKHAFMFTKEKLSGLWITDRGTLGWLINNKIPFDRKWDNLKWRIGRGVAFGVSIDKMKRIMGDDLITTEYLVYAYYGDVQVMFDFYSDHNHNRTKLYGIHFNRQQVE